MPQLALLFIVFYGFARLWNWNLDATGSCVFVFVLWGGAELGDLVRGALVSIPKAQYESAYVLGLNRKQTFLRVILPQALRRLLPASVNLATRIVKTTLLRAIAGLEPIQGGAIAMNGDVIDTGKPGTESAGRSRRSVDLRKPVYGSDVDPDDIVVEKGVVD